MDNKILLFIWLVVLTLDMLLMLVFIYKEYRYWFKYLKVSKKLKNDAYSSTSQRLEDGQLYLQLKKKSCKYELLSWCALLFYNVNSLIYHYTLMTLFWTALSLVFAILTFNRFKRFKDLQDTFDD